MAAVESAVYSLLEVFHKYSAKEGDQLKLNRSELFVLLSQELPCCYRKDAMSLLDLDGDGEVDFLEFIEFITEITTELQEMYLDNIIHYNRVPKFGAHTQSEKAIVTLIKVFYKYAGKGGDPLGLETRELRQLLRKEMPTLNPCLEKSDQFKEMIGNLDRKQKGEVDFKEFMGLVANFAVVVQTTFANDDCDEDDE
ncbi:hypothetical protein XELAEV_18024141mg [Xenopus laevis]|uniref:EF-hand domain-containing protein n=1 Tax=Xenopus laevis TaxID=8355 RepID=A0A974D7Y6_XENLA|nr:hypothetical protein XELAEV_18024141mg [Xenopus laevis]